MNVVLLRGVLSSAPSSRELPSGSLLVSYEVTTRAEGAAADSVPVAWFDPPRRAADLTAGTEVVVTGRVRRRFFRTGGATASRTEVVATAVVPVSQRRRVEKVLQQALAGAGPDPLGAGVGGL